MLWQIHRLDNVDKHRVLLTVGSNFGSANIAPVMEPDIGSLESSGWPPEKIASVREMRPTAPPNPGIQFGLVIALSEPSVIDGEPMVETLHAMIAAVEKIVVSFKPLLE